MIEQRINLLEQRVEFLEKRVYGTFASKEELDRERSQFSVFTDPRDGQKYKTVRLKDGKVWMAQNLNFDVGDSCFYYNNDPENREKYGYLYTWEAALKACPPGWHVPSEDEWRAMARHYGGCNDDSSDEGKVAYKALIYDGSSGFAALLGGYRISDGTYYYLGDGGFCWSSTECDTSLARYYRFDRSDASLYCFGTDKVWAFSCRCVQD